MEWLKATEETVVLDVCCGVGTIGLCASRRCRKVLGIELVPEAVESAKANAAGGPKSEDSSPFSSFFLGFRWLFRLRSSRFVHDVVSFQAKRWCFRP